MHRKQDQRPAPSGLVNKSSSLSSRSAGSATSVGTSRSGGSKLLFGEIDTSSERSSSVGACVNNFVLCESAKFLMFWLDDSCRNTLLSHLPKKDLASLRLVCRDFSAQVAPKLFASLRIDFNPSTFTKAARIAELDRIGSHVERLSFNLPHSAKTFLPPLVDPHTGAELNFTYNPQIQERSPHAPTYGDAWTTDLLARQYPPLFHAATNVHAFIRAFAAFPNLSHLRVSCPGYNTAQRYRRSSVDYALISLRLAIEHNTFTRLRSLTVAPIHPGGLMYLSPLIGFGASPKSASRWTQIRKLTIHLHMLSSSTTDDEPDHFMLLQTYLRNFQNNLQTFRFRWIGQNGPLPVRMATQKPTLRIGRHPAFASSSSDAHSPLSPTKGARALHFPRLQSADIANVAASATDISLFWLSHKTLKELDWDNVQLTSGTWDDVSRSVQRPTPRAKQAEFADIPIMLAPTVILKPEFPRGLERIAADARSRSIRTSAPNWPPKPSLSRPSASQKVRDGWHGCEEHFKRVLRGSVFGWI